MKIYSVYGLPVLFAVASIFMSIAIGDIFRVVLLCIALSVATIIVSMVSMTYRIRKQRSLWPAMVSGLVTLVFIVSVATTCWPMRCAFRFSVQSLETLADRVRGGERILKEKRVGFFTIRSAGLSYDGHVCLWTHLNRNGNTGFIQTNFADRPLNRWSTIVLDERWQFISEE